MLILSFAAYNVIQRHKFLDRLITVKTEEVTSYENMQACLIIMTVCTCLFSLLEVAAYFLYLNKVTAVKSNDLILKQMFQFHPWVKIVVKHSDTPGPQDVTSNSSAADLISQEYRLTLDSQDVSVTENSVTVIHYSNILRVESQSVFL